METSTLLLVAIENPLLDIQLEIETNDLLDKYSLQHGQACLAEDKHQPLFTELWGNDKKVFDLEDRPR